MEVGSQSGLNLKAGTNIGITAVNDVLNNRVEYVVDAWEVVAEVKLRSPKRKQK